MNKVASDILKKYSSSNVKVLYRGSDDSYNSYKNVSWFTEDIDFAEGFGDYIEEVQIDLGNTFDSLNINHVKQLTTRGYKLFDDYSGKYMSPKKASDSSDTWDWIEHSDGVLNYLEYNYNSVRIIEGGSTTNYIVFNANERVLNRKHIKK